MLKPAAVILAVIWFVTPWSNRGFLQTPSRSKEAEQLVFQATNEFRVKNHLRPLIWDQKLSDIAYAHSVDMVVRSFFDHVNPDGQAPAERVHRQHRTFIGITGENLSVLVAPPPFSSTLIAEQAFGGWLKSPPHRQNLLDEAFTHVGIGVAVSGVEAKVTQTFMQVRGILQQPMPESLTRHDHLVLRVDSFPDSSPEPVRYILEPVEPDSEQKERVARPLSETRPPAAPGRYTIQFCFPADRSQVLEIFPGPQIEITK